MRLALLEFCLISLIESARSVRPTTSNVGDHSGQQSDGRLHSPSTYSPNYFAHHKSPHLHLERVKRQETKVWTLSLETTEPSSFTDFSEETDPTTRTTQTTTQTTTRPIIPTKSTNMTTTERTTKETTSTEGPTSTPSTQIFTITGSETANLTLATTAGPRSTSLFLHFIWAFTVLFMICSMGALYYLKRCSEKLNPKKGEFILLVITNWQLVIYIDQTITNDVF